jgi:hypothetical protein
MDITPDKLKEVVTLHEHMQEFKEMMCLQD